MKISNKQLEIIADKILVEWKKSSLVHFKADEKKIHQKIIETMQVELQKEYDLDKEVHAMLDKLERTNGGEFQRYKMYPMIKQKLAKEKKVIL